MLIDNFVCDRWCEVLWGAMFLVGPVILILAKSFIPGVILGLLIVFKPELEKFKWIIAAGLTLLAMIYEQYRGGIIDWSNIQPLFVLVIINFLFTGLFVVLIGRVVVWINKWRLEKMRKRG